MTAAVTKQELSPGVVVLRGTGWDAKLGEVFFGAEGAELEDNRAPFYTIPRDNGAFEVTRSDIPSGAHRLVFFQLLGETVTIDVSTPDGVTRQGDD